MTIRPLLLFAALLTAAPSLDAQAPRAGATLPLRQSSLDKTARDPSFQIPVDSTIAGRWLGGGVTAPRWSPDGQWAYFQYALDPQPILVGNQADDPWWRVSRDGKRVEQVDRAAALAVPTQPRHTRDARRAVWFHRGELRYWKRGAEPRLLLARTDAINPQWTADEKEIRWQENNNLWSLDPETGVTRQLTFAYQQRDTGRVDKTKAELVRQQLEIFEFARKAKTDRDSAYRRTVNDRPPQPITIPFKEGETFASLEIPRGSKYATYIISPRVQTTQTTFSDYVNDSGVVVQRTSRPKVGSAVPVRKAMIVTADPFATPDSVKAVAVEQDTGKFAGKRVTAVRSLWNDQGSRFVVEFQSLDHKDRWLVLVDAATGKHERVLHHIHDDAWFGGAGQAAGWLGASWFEFLPDGESLAYTSEETGWAHLYVVAMDGTRRALTNGDWEIRSIQRSSDETKWWITAGVNHPNELHLYELPFAGGELKRINATDGGEIQPVPSPDGQVLAFRWSSPDELQELYVQPLRAGARLADASRITRSGTDAFYRIAWPESEFISFNDDKGKPVFARVYKPLVPHPNKPAVMEIHGAGYAQGVHKSFAGSGAHGGSQTAQYLTARGVTYMVLDYRGSSGYGRDMRTDIYRSMGDRDVKSAIAAIPVLEQRYGVNKQKVGLFGCSYGGFFTLMALFQHPGVFQGGVAQCSVTDWAHYNHGYTARILNGGPADDTTAYRVSAPINYAAGLKDKLILQHGLVDGNVQYQDAVRLVQRLMELGKDFEFVTYPIDAHGWQSRWARVDSQRRMMKLWDDVLLKTTTGTATTMQERQ